MIKDNRILIQDIIRHDYHEIKPGSDIKLGPAMDIISVCGRIKSLRKMGKCIFLHIEENFRKIQVFISKNIVEESKFIAAKSWKVGDHIEAEGSLFKTEAGEITIKAKDIKLLQEFKQFMPDLHNGITDPETKYRHRHLDLLVNEDSVSIFRKRISMIAEIRQFLAYEKFLEVETPILHGIVGGASAKPFKTVLNYLNEEVNLRIAPELYLKRLMVGGFSRVFEIGKSFRNEGISHKHNPEFTSMEMYMAYSDYHDMMELTNNLLLRIVDKKILRDIRKITLNESLLMHNSDMNIHHLNDEEFLNQKLNSLGVKRKMTKGEMLFELFEQTVEDNLIDPTFIIDYPLDVSPLAKTKEDDPELVERFEFFVNGMELANGFSELTDPIEQSKRLKQQIEKKNAGNDEAMEYDQEFLDALEYGLPPCSGCGIGIDRLVMYATNCHSIKDVILFPFLRRLTNK